MITHMNMKKILIVASLFFLVTVISQPASASLISRPLTEGSSGDDVTLLQRLLNTVGFNVAPSPEAGSLGNETSYFGSLTAAAIQALQCEKGIVCEGTPASTGFGTVGPKTLALLNSLLSAFQGLTFDLKKGQTFIDPRSQLAQISSPLDTDPTLVAHYTFDEGSGTRAGDSSGNGNTGTLTPVAPNGPTWATGKVGNGALSFDGVNDYVNAGSGSLIDNLSTFSASVWVYGNGSGGNSAGKIFSKVTNSAQGKLFTYNFSSAVAAIQFFVHFDGGTSLNVTCANKVILNKWQHWVVTWDGTGEADNVHIYRDGSEVTCGTRTDGTGSAVNEASGNMYIGSAVSGASGFNGLLDDLRIYNRALSATEITQLYNVGQAKIAKTQSPAPCGSGAPLSCGLVGHWTFDGKDTPGRANDISGQGNHGNLVAMSTSTSRVPGKIGQAFKFDGVNDVISVTDIPTLNFG